MGRCLLLCCYCAWVHFQACKTWATPYSTGAWHKKKNSCITMYQWGDQEFTCHFRSGSLLARQISPQLLSDSQVGLGLGAGRSPTATPPVNRKRKSAGSIWPASTCRPDATPKANSSLSFSNSDLHQTKQEYEGSKLQAYTTGCTLSQMPGQHLQQPHTSRTSCKLCCESHALLLCMS